MKTMVSRPLLELCDRSIQVHDPSLHPDSEFTYIDISSINSRTKTIEAPKLVRGASASVRARQVIRANDVLLSTVRPNLNSVAMVPAELDGEICSTGFCVLRCGPRLVPGYVFAFVQSHGFVEQLIELVQGALYPAVTEKQVFAVEIPWLPIAKQEEIARKFKVQIEAVRQAQDAARRQLEECAQLQNKLRMKACEQLESAAEIRLGDLIQSIETGKSIQTTEQIARADQLGVLKVSAVSWGEFRANEAKATEPDYTPVPHHRVKRGDVLISRANTVQLVGAIVRTDRDHPYRLLSDKTLRLILDESKCDPDFIVEVMRLPDARGHIESNATGTSDSMRNISQDTIRTTPIRLPSLPEQRRIAGMFREADVKIGSLKAALQKQLRDLDLLPQKLLAQVFDA